jgi:seryl-tRNA synthetase
MHDIRLIREHKAGFEAALLKRNDSFNGVADELLRLDEERRRLIASVQEMQERRNAASKEIGQAKAQKDEARAQGLMAEVSGLKERLPGAEAELKAIEAELNARLASLPNLPGEDVPEGADEHANVERHRHGQPRIYSFEARQHFDIGETLGQMDFETAARLSGSRFVVTKGPLARLERALGQFMLDTHVAEHGYLEVNPPLLVADHAMYGTAQLPKFEDDQFWAVAGGLLQEGEAGLVDRIRTSRLGLIPTAEVPLTNLVRELILDEKELPLRFAALTPCFRAEAGAAGRDTRGMIRQHQFSKVEMVSVTTPEASRDRAS